MNDKNRVSGTDAALIMAGIGKKKSKYGSIRTPNGDGTFSDSRKEARLDAEFMAMQKSGVQVIRKERFKFVINGVHICTYEADWTVYRNGRREVFDAKGYKTREYKIKKALMKALFNIDIQEV
jgi:hypothetical protein